MNLEAIRNHLFQNRDAMIAVNHTLSEALKEVELDDPARVEAHELAAALDCIHQAAVHIGNVRRQVKLLGGY